MQSSIPSRLSLSLLPISPSDIPHLASLAADAFASDKQTQLKALGRNPYDLAAVMTDSLTQNINSTKHKHIKAINNETGETAGWICWAFRGFDEAEVQDLEPVRRPTNTTTGTVSDQKGGHTGASEPEKKSNTQEATEQDEDDPIARLSRLTSDDLQRWIKILAPDGSKCMIITTLIVAPSFQSRGVGSALLRWGTEIADRFGVYAWVHSSDSGWQAFEKSGFQVVGTLEVNLDDYVPTSKEREGGWGVYTFRYMKRLPRQ